MLPGGPRPAWWVAAAWGLLPAAGYGLARALGPAGPEGLFRAGVVALALSSALGAFLLGPLRSTLGTLLLGVGALGLSALAETGAAGAAGACAALSLGTALAAAGLSRVGRAVGAGWVGAGGTAFLVLVAALCGLGWADPLAEALPASERWAFRQAVLHLDPATAYAYDAAGFDRLLDPPVYAEIPLASSFHERPRALTTAALWGVLGLLGLAAGAAGRRPSEVPAEREPARRIRA